MRSRDDRLESGLRGLHARQEHLDGVRHRMGLVPDPLANNREKPTTLTTTMIATSPIDPMRVFLHAAKLLGANEGYDFHINEHRINAKLGQGLPALLWVSHNESKLLAPGEYWTNDPWDKRLAGPEPEVIYRPRGYVDIYLDTVHGYGKSDGFGGHLRERRKTHDRPNPVSCLLARHPQPDPCPLSR